MSPYWFYVSYICDIETTWEWIFRRRYYDDDDNDDYEPFVIDRFVFRLFVNKPLLRYYHYVCIYILLNCISRYVLTSNEKYLILSILERFYIYIVTCRYTCERLKKQTKKCFCRNILPLLYLSISLSLFLPFNKL